MFDDGELVKEFNQLINKDVAVPVCAMKFLISVIKKSQAQTWMELERNLRMAIDHLINSLNSNASELHLSDSATSFVDLKGRTSISLVSGCELFMKYVTNSFSLTMQTFNECRDEIVRRGDSFIDLSDNARKHIAEIGHSFVQDGHTVLIHGYSRVVVSLLLKAAESGKQFRVIVTEGRPSLDGAGVANIFIAAGIPTTLVLDCNVAMCMNSVDYKVDLCLVGAEGVIENGGIVNKLGTYQLAIIAKAHQVPFYVAVESYKFARDYPLTTRDIQDMLFADNKRRHEADIRELEAVRSRAASNANGIVNVAVYTPTVIDFTPADFITLLFTDLGVLTPAAISDELIRMML